MKTKFFSLFLCTENMCVCGISKFYKNKGMRQSTLQKICEGMQIEIFTAEDVKNKVKRIRSTYNLALDKI